MPHRLEDIVGLFNGLFLDTYNTRLVRGGDEPLYLPANHASPHHRVIFAHGYFASALHEVSHWCIAGTRRRTLEDYGYWYLPDGRDETQQRQFESVEVAPQALELLFTRACGRIFRVSVDNLDGVEVDWEAFLAQVEARAHTYEQSGLPARAAAFREALRAFYCEGESLEEALERGRRHLPAHPANA